jgi:cytochrome b561
MAAGKGGAGYGAVAKSLHWLVALLVVAMFLIAWYMFDLPIGPEKIKIYNLHKSIGILIGFLMLLRLAWRLAVVPAPPLPATMATWERGAAHASHAALYLLLIAQPLVGWLHSSAANFPVVVFGLFTLPPLVAPSESLKQQLAAAHYVIALAILVLVALHVAAALRHHFLLKDEVLRRMLPGAAR